MFEDRGGNDSSDSEDEDFVPTGEVHDASEEENSGEDEEVIHGKKKKKPKPKKKERGGLFKDASSEAEAEEEDEEKRKRELQEEEDQRKLNEKKKTDNLWAEFMGGVTEKKKPKPAKNVSGGGFGSFGVVSKPMDASKTKKKAAKRKPTSSIFDLSAETKSDTSTTTTISAPKSIVSSIFESNTTIKKPERKEEKKVVEEEKPKVVDDSKITITQIYDFAGENIELTKEFDKESKEAKAFLKAKEKEAEEVKKAKKPAGLGNLMSIIDGKKPKLGCLDKTKMDWETFVEKEGIKEELKTFNKGKDGYMEKQMFLERADYRRFEAEKAAREKTRKSLNR